MVLTYWKSPIQCSYLCGAVVRHGVDVGSPGSIAIKHWKVLADEEIGRDERHVHGSGHVQQAIIGFLTLSNSQALGFVHDVRCLEPSPVPSMDPLQRS